MSMPYSHFLSGYIMLPNCVPGFYPGCHITVIHSGSLGSSWTVFQTTFVNDVNIFSNTSQLVCSTHLIRLIALDEAGYVFWGEDFRSGVQFPSGHIMCTH